MSEKTERPAHEVLGGAYRDRSSGRLVGPSGPTNLFFHRGDLFVHPRHPSARRVEEGLEGEGADLQEVAETLGRELSGVELTLEPDSVRPETLLGPLPTATFVMEAVVSGADEKELVKRLGGPANRWSNGDGSRAVEELPGLDPASTRVLSRLGGTVSPAELMRAEDRTRMEQLQALVRLAAVGLAKPLDQAGQEIVTPRALRLFRERLSTDLKSTPLELLPAEHRQQVADLYSRMGGLDYYQLLGIDPEADESQLLDAYHQLARLVHPNHADRLGIPDRNRLLEVLFERVTEAYLVLDDPKRRAAYNTLAGIGVRSEVDGEQRDQEKQGLARLSYSHASSFIANMDFSQAIELLKEAARLDPRPEYFARLAQVQAKNPNWLDAASASYEKALDLEPDHAGYRVGLAEILEKRGKADLALEQYQRALDLMPSHPKAQDGVERLQREGAGSRSRGLRGLLGRKD